MYSPPPAFCQAFSFILSDTLYSRGRGSSIKGINTEFCAVMDYFEIFLERMLLCRRAAEFLELTFKLDINGLSLL